MGGVRSRVEKMSGLQRAVKSAGILGGVMLFGWILMKMTTPSREQTIKVQSVIILGALVL